MIGVTVSGNEMGGSGLGDDAAERQTERRGTILDAESYARRLGVSLAMFRQAFKIVRGKEVEPGSSLDRVSLRRLAARIAPPTAFVRGTDSRGIRPAPAWYVGDIENFEEDREARGKKFGVTAEYLADVIAALDPPLSERERLVLDRRLAPGGPVSRRKIALELGGISEERVRQIEVRTRRRIEEYLPSSGRTPR